MVAVKRRSPSEGGGFAGQLGSGETLELALSRSLHARANGGRVFGVTFIGQLRVVDAGHFDVDVDAVQQRAADALPEAHNGEAEQLHSLIGTPEEGEGVGVR